MPTRQCNYPECSNPLRVDNKSGVCRVHIRYRNRCRKCDQLCYANRRYCAKCSHIFKTWRAKVIVICQYEDCKKITKSQTKLCVDHYKHYWKCESPGCLKRCRFTSKWRLCADHQGVVRKLINAGVEPYKWDSKQIVKKRIPKTIRKSRAKPQELFS